MLRYLLCAYKIIIFMIKSVITLNMEKTYYGYCLARDIAMPYSPLSLLQVVAVVEMAAVSSATL